MDSNSTPSQENASLNPLIAIPAVVGCTFYYKSGLNLETLLFIPLRHTVHVNYELTDHQSVDCSCKWLNLNTSKRQKTKTPASREAGRQGGREAGRQGGREAGRQGGREAGRQGGREAGRQGGREAGRQGGREAGRQGGREAGRQGGREAGRQGGREAGRQGGREHHAMNFLFHTFVKGHSGFMSLPMSTAKRFRNHLNTGFLKNLGAISLT